MREWQGLIPLVGTLLVVWYGRQTYLLRLATRTGGAPCVRLRIHYDPARPRFAVENMEGRIAYNVRLSSFAGELESQGSLQPVKVAFKDHPQQTGLQRAWFPPYLSHAAGAMLGIKKWLHKSTGGFDESWPALSDTEYCFRLQLAGVGLHFVPDAVVHYRCRRTYGGLFTQASSWGEHFVRLHKEHRPPGTTVAHPWRRHVGEWKRLVRNAPNLRFRDHRPRWVWRLGWQIGLIRGSIKHRIAPV